MDDREELTALRRLAELEAKAGNASPIQSQTAPSSKRDWADIPGEALSSAPGSAIEFGKGMYQAVRHPLDTAGNLIDAAAGGLQKAAMSVIPESMQPDKTKESFLYSPRAEQTANAVGGVYKDRYGSIEGLKNTLATDPVGAAADLSSVLTGGAALASKIPKAATLTSALKTGAKYTNPINAVGGAAKAIGSGAANLIGGLGTHTGGEGLKQAARSGYADPIALPTKRLREIVGTPEPSDFIKNLRGQVPMTDVLDTVKANIEAMGKEKSAAYRAGMGKVSGDKTILSFDGIDKTLKDVSDAVTFKGQVKNVKAAETGQKIVNEVEKWKNLDPKEFHTPEGLDALKQKISGIVESIPFEEKTARMVGTKAYNAIKDEIVKQAPVYAKTMKGYAEASEQIKEIERALSAGDRASVDTAMRKLQSLTRNNVNTNYGNRLELAKQLEKRGGHEFLPALAGQSLNSWTPRGLGSLLGGGVGAGSIMLGEPLTGAGILAAQSPRLMGETALKVGQLSKLAKPIAENPNAANALYQAGRLPQDDESRARAQALAEILRAR